MEDLYDVIIAGAGHAGCEAAVSAARLGSRVLLITLDMNGIAQMSCNPAIGGIAKGQIVREIDALGGQMGIIADATSIQFRMLNRSKGPAMWSPRSQNDRQEYVRTWRRILEQTDGLSIWQDEVTELLISGGQVGGVKTRLGMFFTAKAVILTNGTFLNGLMHFGSVRLSGGRIAEPASSGLSRQLREIGHRSGRMKTGTPPRIDAGTVDFSLCTPQYGDNDFHRFSFLDTPVRIQKQLPCFLTYTNEEVHRILSEHLSESPLYNGRIQSVGPRYCPSIETKIQTFPDKDQHQLFLEPEGEETTEYYVNGFSTSLPIAVQLEAIRRIPALKQVRLFRPGYAIEYDYFDPMDLSPSLESKILGGLFLAGQINGTTGYEEAAAQGLMAGINAHLSVHGGESFVLARNRAYIGVLIDDLVTKGVDEPYRMFTSRAEYRILLRQDDADSRLTPLSRELGLATSLRHERCMKKIAAKNELIDFAASAYVYPEDLNAYLASRELPLLQQKAKLKDVLLRPGLTIPALADCLPFFARYLDRIGQAKDEVIESAEVLLKYSGYIDRERLQAEKVLRFEGLPLPADLDYAAIEALSIEARQKLERIRPRTIGQASRIPGISPHDVSILLVICGR